uniref:Uncharacterized protein n=1 Tax=Asparagus officinalis TaxID=4686 RepID=Q2AA31_ASPOF|nr:hypothetical protein 20.t00033 [Asparagus officinalis]
MLLFKKDNHPYGVSSSGGFSEGLEVILPSSRWLAESWDEVTQFKLKIQVQDSSVTVENPVVIVDFFPRVGNEDVGWKAGINSGPELDQSPLSPHRDVVKETDGEATSFFDFMPSSCMGD